MKFKHGTRRRAAEYEKDWVQRFGSIMRIRVAFLTI